MTTKGNFHTLANLTQTLNTITSQHFSNIHTQKDATAPAALPQFMAEGVHLICRNLAMAVNGEVMQPEAWANIATYASEVEQILSQARQEAIEAQASKDQASAQLHEPTDVGEDADGASKPHNLE